MFIEAQTQLSTLGATAESVRQLGGEPLEPSGRSTFDGRVP